MRSLENVLSCASLCPLEKAANCEISNCYVMKEAIALVMLFNVQLFFIQLEEKKNERHFQHGDDIVLWLISSILRQQS